MKWIMQKIKELRCRHHKKAVSRKYGIILYKACCVTITEKNMILRFCCHCGKRY